MLLMQRQQRRYVPQRQHENYSNYHILKYLKMIYAYLILFSFVCFLKFQQRLGHKIKHSKSIKYATNIANKKKSEAPEAPVSFGEAIQSVPMSY